MRYTRRDFGKLAIGRAAGGGAAEPAVSSLRANRSRTRSSTASTSARSRTAIAACPTRAPKRSFATSSIRASARSSSWAAPSRRSQALLRCRVAMADAAAPSRRPSSRRRNARRRRSCSAWRTSVSMDRFKALRKMFNDAGVTIYAWKQLAPEMSDAEMEYVFNVAEALGCTHTTLELVDDLGGVEADRRVRGKAQGLRRVPHASAGQHDRLRPGICSRRNTTWRTWTSDITWLPAATRFSF